MRVRLVIEDGILGCMRKLWIDLPNLSFVFDFLEFISQTFMIEVPIEAWMNDFYLHKNLKFGSFVENSEIFFIKGAEKKICPARAGPERKKLMDQDSKKKAKNLRKELKRNPDCAPFQGKKIKFDTSGNVVKVSNVTSELNILSPAEEFDKKKSSWKIKPIPKRRQIVLTNSAPGLISSSQPLLPHELSLNDFISYSTISDAIVRRGTILEIEEKSVHISVSSDTLPNGSSSGASSPPVTILKSHFREILKLPN